MALGDFYDGVGGHADTITEAYQGRTLRLLSIPQLVVEQPADFVAFLQGQVREIEGLRYEAVAREDTTIQNMIDYYYAFPDRMTMYSALEPLGMIYATDDGPQVIQATHQYAAWVVDLIPPNETAWHLNVRLIDDTFDLSSLEPYIVQPKQPVCVWA